MAPPQGFSLSMSNFITLWQARIWEEKASLISMISMSSRDIFAISRAFGMATVGPSPMWTASRAPLAYPAISARGV